MPKKMTPERAVRSIVKELESRSRNELRCAKRCARDEAYEEASRRVVRAQATVSNAWFVARRFRELMGITILLALAFLVTACSAGVAPCSFCTDGGAVSEASTSLDASLDGSDAAPPTPDASADGSDAATPDASLDAGTDLPATDAGVTDAMAACVETWPLRSGAIELYGCALPLDNVCTSMPTVPTADVQACEDALRAATGCEDIDVPACWYVSPAGALDGGDCIHGTPSSVCMDPSDCREHRAFGFVCLPCCP